MTTHSQTRSNSSHRCLPPDPEGLNDRRAEWAEHALTQFAKTTGTDDGDALSDLLADLMHWCDRNDARFGRALRRARWHYAAETEGDG